jgi:UDP-GlcNAc:undecaprenyl-phosphate/decaprenyl-phosphate GlcNAc-1-phosphate transferase
MRFRGASLPFLEAVEDKFDPGGDAELVKDLKKVVSHDSGATVLGFAIAFLAFQNPQSSSMPRSSLAFPIVAAGLPLLDTAFAAIRRVRARGSPLYGDRRHAYDLLLARGWRPRGVALAFYAVTVALALAGWACGQKSTMQTWIAAGVALGTLFACAIGMGLLRAEDKQPEQRPTLRAENPGVPMAD